MRKGTQAILIFLILIVNVVAADDFEIIRSKNPLGRDTLNYQEDLIIKSCLQGLKIYAMCEKPVQFSQHLWEDDCKMYSINMERLNCKTPIIDFIQNNVSINKTKLNIQKIKGLPQIVLPYQLDDGSWETAEETAFSIWLLSHFGSNYMDEVDKGLEWLKQERLNKEKCWTERFVNEYDCSLGITSKVLAYLDLADYDETRRVVNDGQVWINSKQNFIKASPWHVTFSTNLDDGTNCTFGYDSQSSFNLDEDEDEKFEITPEPGEWINMTCEDPVSMVIENDDGDTIFYDNTYHKKYAIPGSCWSDQNWIGTGDAMNVYSSIPGLNDTIRLGTSNSYPWIGCDINSTIFATMANVNKERKELGIEYLKDLMQKGELTGKYVPGGSIYKNSALYLEYLEDNSELKRFFVYNQNNDGSWGKGDVSQRMLDTLYITFALEGKKFSTSKETLNDANEWLIKNVPFEGWNQMEHDAMTFLVLKDKIPPFVKTSPIIFFMNNTDTLEVQITNPTLTDYNNISYSATSEMSTRINIDIESKLKSDSTIKATIKQTGKQDGVHFGTVNIVNGSLVMKKVPIVIINNPFLNIIYPKTVNVINTSTFVQFGLKKSEATFKCVLESDQDILHLQNNIISTGNSISFLIRINESKRQDIDYRGLIKCDSELYKTQIPIEFTINQYPTYPLINIPDVEITKRRQIPDIVIKNIIDDPINVTLKFKTLQPYFAMEPERLEIPGGKKKTVRIFNEIPAGINFSVTNDIVITTLEHDKEIKFFVNVTDLDKSSSSTLVIVGKTIKWIVILVIVGLLTGVVYYYTQSADKRKKLLILIKKKLGMKVIEEKVEEVQPEETITESPKASILLDDITIELIRVVEQLFKRANKSEEEVIRTLQQSGFSEDKIKYALEVIKQG